MKRFTLFICLLGLSCNLVMAQKISIATAGGFKPAMEQLVPLFEELTGHQVSVSYGSVGSLYAQIRQGAPFAILLSAETKTPARLERSGIGVKGSRFSYAMSKLVLWSPKANFVDSKGEILQQDRFHHLALPNPKVGVHGAAAMEALKSMGLIPKLSPKFVEGKNVLQTFQHIETGGAELGFISWSLIYRKGEPVRGSFWEVPQNLHSPIQQQAILLQKGDTKKAASEFLKWLKGESAREVMIRYGYSIPKNPPD